MKNRLRDNNFYTTQFFYIEGSENKLKIDSPTPTFYHAKHAFLQYKAN